MANEEQLAILRQGVEAWNEWRREHLLNKVDLSEADLQGADLKEARLFRAVLSRANLSHAKLMGADLSDADLLAAKLNGADLSEAKLTGADLSYASLSVIAMPGKTVEAKLMGADLSLANLSHALLLGADLSDAKLIGASLFDADLRSAKLMGADLGYAGLSSAKLMGADLSDANLIGASLSDANLSAASLIDANLSGTVLSGAVFNRADCAHAKLSGADLRRAILTGTRLVHADLSDSTVYGISVWNTDLTDAIQKDIVITDDIEPKITVDNLEVAQFIHLLLTNEKIRDVIDTIAKKVVLILGRFTEERKAVLDAIRERLRKEDYSPVLFDFERPVSRNLAETVRTLAHLSRFIIADIQAAKSIPQELGDIVPKLKIPVVPIIKKRARPWAMWRDIKEYPWVMEAHRYNEVEQLLDDLVDTLIPQALDMEKEIAQKRLEED